MLSEKRCAEFVKKWRENGFPLKSGGAAPPLFDSTARVITTWETGNLFAESKLVRFFYDFGAVVLNLLGPSVGWFQSRLR